MPVTIELDLGRLALHDVEHGALHLHAAVPDVVLAGTRVDGGRCYAFVVAPRADGETLHAAESFATSGGYDLDLYRDWPADGRVVRFAGQELLRGEVRVRDVIERTAIDNVHALGARIADESLIVTHDFVRPVIANGELVLYVTPLADGRFEPFEREFPHQCCEVSAG